MDVLEGVLEKIKECDHLLQLCKETFAGIIGISRLVKRIESESKFYKKLQKNPHKLKVEHLKSSNLTHIHAIIKCCQRSSNVVKVLEPFHFKSDDDSFTKCIVIDAVTDYGQSWIKVVARNPTAVLQISLGVGKYGVKSLVDQLQEILVCATQNKYLFNAPKVQVWFAGGVTSDLTDCLSTMPVEIHTLWDNENSSFNELNHIPPLKCENGNKIPLAIQDEAKKRSTHTPMDLKPQEVRNLCEETSKISLWTIPKDAVINLDVSTMIALVSNVTNGHCNIVLADKILNEQAQKERSFAVKPEIDKLTNGHKMICCESAHKDFLNIVSTIGGAEEKLRAKEFLSHVTIVPDNPSPNALALKASGQIRERTKIIFGTGDSEKAVTLSANKAFLKAAYTQGVKFAAVIHEARALTESKEIKDGTELPRRNIS